MGKENGGPAFPMSFGSVEDHTNEDGMTLRDYFASECPITLTEASKCYTGGKQDNFLLNFCRLRFEYADAMLEARKK